MRAPAAALLLLAIPARPAVCAEYVVAPSGSRANAGTLASPWDLETANRAVRPGDRVELRGGTYHAPIRPRRSGTATAPIRYAARAGETPLLTGRKPGGTFTCLLVTERSHVEISGIHCDGIPGADGPPERSSVSNWATLREASHVEISGCRFEDAWRNGVELFGSHHVHLHGNVLLRAGAPLPKASGEALRIAGSHHNLFERNEAAFGGHNVVQIQGGSRFNVIRENDLRNPWWRVGVLYDDGGFNLIESNRIRDAHVGVDVSNHRLVPAWKIWSSHNIYRRNLFYDNARFGVMIAPRASGPAHTEDNKIYHNVFYENARAGLLFLGDDSPNASARGNGIVNNVFAGNGMGTGDGEQLDFWPKGGRIEDLRFRNNGFPEGDGRPVARTRGVGEGAASLGALEETHAASFTGNLEAGPKFAGDARRAGFALEATSPLIDRGAFLTRTVGAGSGTRVRVADAGYFSDGFGIVEGDLVQLEGSREERRVVAVDYAENTLSLDGALAWRDDQGVALRYAGTAPDIGAVEWRPPETAGAASEVP